VEILDGEDFAKTQAPARDSGGTCDTRISQVHSPSPAGTLTAWFPGAATTGRGAGPYCFPGRKTKWVCADQAREHCSTRVAGLQLLDGIESLVAEIQPVLFRITQRRPGGGEQFQGQPPGNQRQDAKRDVNHGCCISNSGATP